MPTYTILGFWRGGDDSNEAVEAVEAQGLL
jgi:hypothetical protein